MLILLSNVRQHVGKVQNGKDYRDEFAGIKGIVKIRGKLEQAKWR